MNNIINDKDITNETYYTMIDEKNKYDYQQKAFASVSGLLSPAKIFYLKLMYPDIPKPASSLIDIALGNAWHSMHEQALKNKPEYIVEKRIFKSVIINNKEYIITGKPDAIDTSSNKLIDYKCTNIYVVEHEKQMDKWEKQLNIYAWMLNTGYATSIDDLNKNGNHLKTKITQLDLQALSKNWTLSQSKKKKDYPKHITSFNLKMLSNEMAEEMVKYMILKLAKWSDTPINEIPECNFDERWQTRDVYAVMKKGRKSAMKLCSSIQAAKNYLRNKVKPEWKPISYIQVRPGYAARCIDYCYYRKKCNYGMKLDNEGRL